MIPFQKKRVELKQHGSFEVDVPGAEIELEFLVARIATIPVTPAVSNASSDP